MFVLDDVGGESTTGSGTGEARGNEERRTLLSPCA